MNVAVVFISVDVGVTLMLGGPKLPLNFKLFFMKTRMEMIRNL